MIKYVIDNALAISVGCQLILVLVFISGLKHEQTLYEERMDALCSPLQEGKRSFLCVTWRGPADKVFRTNVG